jgi:replicative DNA helicase
VHDAAIPLGQVLATAEATLKKGKSAAPRTWATGFTPLDTYLGGGLRAGELILLGGPQGLGKTSLVLQALRNAVTAGGHGIYFSFEHDEQTILERMVGIEVGAITGSEGPTLRLIRESLEDTATKDDLGKRLSVLPGGAEAVKAIESYGDRLVVHRSTTLTTPERIREICLERAKDSPPVIVIDYLQKVGLLDGSDREDERVTRIVEGLKDMALELGAPVLAIVAADREGLVAGKRLRIHNLRGSSALAYEADVVLIINDKFDVVARHHLVYDVANAERYRDYVVLTIEKNRSGIDRVDLEFRKVFDQGRFDTKGNAVGEQLVDERVYVE